MTYKINPNIKFKSYEELHATELIVTLNTSEGLVAVYRYADSGRVVTRMKIDTITGVYHPGIVIGRDKFGRTWVAHNHYKIGRPTFQTMDLFTLSAQPLWDSRQVDYSREEVVQRAIAEAQRGISYDTIRYNCQTFVNLIVQDKNKSEAVDKISDGAMIGGSILALIGMLTKNKALMYTGLGIAGAAGIGKGVSRIRK